MSHEVTTVCDAEDCSAETRTDYAYQLPAGWWHTTLDLGTLLYVRVELHLCPEHVALSRRDPGWLLQMLTSRLDARVVQQREEQRLRQERIHSQ